jgi:pSer/pThr/pTyr-binding forkhead associated (FHA) protein
MKLVAQSGPLAGQELPLPSDKPVIIGREAGNDIRLADGQVSRRHAEIRYSVGQVSIIDAGSMNGTFVNDERVQGTRVLRPGDMIRIGSTRFVLQEGTVIAPMASALAEPPPVAPSKANLTLMVGGMAALILLGIVGAIGFLFLNSGKSREQASRGTGTPRAIEATLTAVQPIAAAATPGTPMPAGPTPTSLIELFVTLTSKPGVSTVTPSTGGGSSQPASTQAQPFTVSWSPGRYEGWADGRRMSSDLTIQNNNLPQISPPYTPYFIVSDAQGKMRQADLQDYGGGRGLPTIPKGQKIVWTWFGVMSDQEWVRGSVFRYGGYAWAQEFNPDGSLNGPPRVIDEKQLIPFLPRQIPPEMLATLAATITAGGVPTGIPTGVPKP